MVLGFDAAFNYFKFNFTLVHSASSIILAVTCPRAMDLTFSGLPVGNASLPDPVAVLSSY